MKARPDFDEILRSRWPCLFTPIEGYPGGINELLKKSLIVLEEEIGTIR
jgi:hypothetical protein